MSLMRRAKLYLGLGADADYDEFGDPYSDARSPQPAQSPYPQEQPAVRRTAGPGEPSGSVRTLSSDPGNLKPVPSSAPQGPVVASTSPPPSTRPTGSVVRTVAPPVRTEPTVITPRSYNEAKEIGDTFKNRQPVIINLQDLPPDLGHRLVDFASGLIFALDGQIKKVTKNVFLLTPANVEVDDPSGMSDGDSWE